MNTVEKIRVLGNAAKYDICASTSCRPDAVKASSLSGERVGNLTGGGICHSFTPDGRCVSLFKVLLSNSCEGDCRYCLNNCNMRGTRTSFEPDELKNAFLSLYRQNYVEGIFLSSAVRCGADRTEEDLLGVSEGLRKDGFKGYIHLKVMPGTSRDLVKRATDSANRVSINLEAPNRLRFQELTSTKDFKLDLLRRMRWVQKYSDERVSSGQTTQFVVGACGESDKEVLRTVDSLYGKLELKRSYFSAFSPVAKTPLEGMQKTPLVRENRLYQCDFLMRKYDFSLNDLVFGDDDCLDLSLDPKMVFALNNKDLFPLEVNEASYNELLRVPGIGPQSAMRISQMTARGFRFSKPSELRNLGIVMKKARAFISVAGSRQTNLASFENVT